MFVPFESISPKSRIWIYQSDRKLTDAEKTIMNDLLGSFTNTWAAHGEPLRTSFDIRYDHFIILAADEDFNSASGCSIDGSVRVIKEIEQRVGIQLFDRQKVAFLKNNVITTMTLSELKQKYLEGIWNESTPAFNNLVSIKGQLDSDWIVPAGKTWLKRYTPGIKVAP